MQFLTKKPETADIPHSMNANGSWILKRTERTENRVPGRGDCKLFYIPQYQPSTGKVLNCTALYRHIGVMVVSHLVNGTVNVDAKYYITFYFQISLSIMQR